MGTSIFNWVALYKLQQNSEGLYFCWIHCQLQKTKDFSFDVFERHFLGTYRIRGISFLCCMWPWTASSSVPQQEGEAGFIDLSNSGMVWINITTFTTFITTFIEPIVTFEDMFSFDISRSTNIVNLLVLTSFRENILGHRTGYYVTKINSLTFRRIFQTFQCVPPIVAGGVQYHNSSSK